MGQTDDVTKHGPSQRLEAVVALLTPPARREEVLGDLHERYASITQYLADTLRTVPLVVLSQIRRTTDPGLLLLEALALYFSYFAGGAQSSSLMAHAQPGILAATLPVIGGLLSLSVVDAYMEKSPRRAFLGASFAAIGYALVEAAIPVFYSGFERSPWIYLRSGVVAVIVLSSLRLVYSNGEDSTALAGTAARHQGSTPATANLKRALWDYLIAAFTFLAFAAIFAESQNRAVRMGATLILFLGLRRLLNNVRARSNAKPTKLGE
jgi:hypothetical protein